MTNYIPLRFNGTCVPVTYPCTVSSRYVDPCDCSFYYLCRADTTIIRRACAPGTAYDHTSNLAYCNRFSDVIVRGICNQMQPWQRCQDDHPTADLPKLQKWCTGTGYFTPPPKRQEPDDDGNAGAIAAIVITLLLIIAAVVLIAIYVRRKGNPIKNIKESLFWKKYIQRGGHTQEDDNSPGSTPRYDDPDAVGPSYDDEETYTELDDGAVYPDHGRVPSMKKSSSFAAYPDPSPNGGMSSMKKSSSFATYTDPDSARRKSSLKQTPSFANGTYGKKRTSFADHFEEEEGAVGYDNPALQVDRETTPPDTDRSPAPPAYSAALTEAELQHHADLDGAGAQWGDVGLEMRRLGPDSATVRPDVDEDGYLVASQPPQPVRQPPRLPPLLRAGESGGHFAGPELLIRRADIILVVTV